ncbi:MAG: rhodanese-like domain-containing protein, partial [Myxococcales bacterium]|nr:rhodanese-like domain-containing protein [Myxococcales bacterium]
HVAGAVNITHTAVLDRIDEIRELQGNDPSKPIVLYCRSGRRADAAKEELLQAGFTRITNLGGLKDWPD